MTELLPDYESRPGRVGGFPFKTAHALSRTPAAPRRGEVWLTLRDGVAARVRHPDGRARRGDADGAAPHGQRAEVRAVERSQFGHAVAADVDDVDDRSEEHTSELQ